MSKCNTCRKADALDSWWDKIRLRMFHVFHTDIVDLSQQKFTQGFGDGYLMGRRHEREAHPVKVQEPESTTPEFSEFPVLIQANKVLTTGSNGQIFLMGTPIQAPVLENLKREVSMFGNSDLWSIITNTIAHQAEEAGWKASKDLQDLFNAKMMVRTIDIQRNIIKKIQDAK